jgi:hypothetical protein
VDVLEFVDVVVCEKDNLEELESLAEDDCDTDTLGLLELD